MNLAKMAHREPQHLCIFGEPKSGKSELAATVAERFKRVIWISNDNGYEVLFKLPPELQAKIDVIRLPDTKEFPVAIDTCLKLVTGVKQRICCAHGQVDCSHCKKNKDSAWDEVCFNDLTLDECVVFDHVSQLADSAMNFICKGKKDDFFPGWDEFRLQGILMSKFFMNIQQAPYHCICIAHVCETEMEDGS